MKRYFEKDGLTFEIEYFEKYEKSVADKMARGLTDEQMDSTFIEGTHRVRGIKILQDEYKKQAVSFKRDCIWCV